MPAHGLDHFVTTLERLAAEDRFTGSVAVTRGDELILEVSYGYANRAWKAPCGPETRFDTASITKLFTAVATLQMVERGAFGLDTSAKEFLGLDDAAFSSDVSVYHLLTHTSGIADDADEEAGERYEDLFVDKPNYAIRETADHLPNFIHKPPVFAPGAGCRYCNVSFVLLGLMVERASGVPYRQFVESEVFARAGMDRSAFFRMDVVEPDIAEGVEPILEGDRVVGYRRNIFSYPPVGDPAGGAYCTVGDLLTFRRAVRDGRLLGPEMTAALLRPHCRHGDKDGVTRMIGFGFEFSVAPDGSVREYWKEGVNPGVSGLLQHYPEQDLTLAILGVGEAAVWKPARALDKDIR